MTKEEYLSGISGFKDEGWIHIDDRLPSVGGTYNTIILKGSMSKKFSVPTLKLFHRGAFPRMDWDYVLFWKPVPEKKDTVTSDNLKVKEKGNNEN